MIHIRSLAAVGILALGFASAPAAFAATAAPSAGFVDASIWFSEESFVAGDTIRIHTAVWNGEDEGLSGTAQFYDKSTLIGKRSFAVAPGSLESVSVEWRATAGDHVFSVKLVDSKFADGREVPLSASETTSFKKTVSRAPISLQTAGVIDVLESDAAEKAGDRVENQVEAAESFVAGIIPEPVMEVLGATFEPVERFRIERIDTIDERTETVRAELDAYEAAKEEASDDDPSEEAMTAEEGAVEAWNGPLKYAYYFFLKLLTFIYTHALVFYIVLAYIAYIALRFVFRMFRPKAD